MTQKQRLRVQIKWSLRNYIGPVCVCRGTPYRSWWRHRAASRKVAPSITDGVIGIFYSYNFSERTMARPVLGSLYLLYIYIYIYIYISKKGLN